MGKIIVTIKLTNLTDIILKQAGAREAEPRATEVEALVDTGATRLCLKPSVVARLGLKRVGDVFTRTSNGHAMRAKFEPVELELMGRREIFDVVEVPEKVLNLLGQVPLEVLDFVVDPAGQALIPNPAHDGQQMSEEYLFRNPWPKSY